METPSLPGRALPTAGSVPLGRKVEVVPEPPKASPAPGPEERRLPLLPIPSLDQTCRRFLEVVAGVLTPEELESTKEEIESFRTSDGVRLDTILQGWKPEDGSRSYVERCVCPGLPRYCHSCSLQCSRCGSAAARGHRRDRCPERVAC